MANFEYNFCPVCATSLVDRDFSGQMRRACPACGFIHFIDPKVAVIGVVTVADQVLVTRRAVDPQKGKWSLPGGYMDAGEMPLTALQRELMEEVGLPIEVGDLLEFFPLKNETGKTVGVVLAFLAWPTSGSADPLESNDDVSEALWVTSSDVPTTELAFESTSLLLERWSKMINEK